MTETMNAPAWATAWTEAALAALPADITTATPPQVDEVIRTVGLDAEHMNVWATRAINGIRKAIGQVETETYERTARGRRTIRHWPTTAAEAVAEARAMDPATPNADFHTRTYGEVKTVGDALAALDAVKAQRAEADAIVERMCAEYVRRGGWARYFRVNNSNGHVHTSMNCRECYATTQYNWPTQLSGADGAGVVEAAGALTCLTCFPEQRADILAGRPTDFAAFETTEQRAARAERDAEKAARNAAKIAKGVTPDGSPLMVNMGEHDIIGFGRVLEVKTERAAQLRYVELAAIGRGTQRWARAADRPIAAAAARTLAEALAWKRNTAVSEIERTLAKKVQKKIDDGF